MKVDSTKSCRALPAFWALPAHWALPALILAVALCGCAREGEFNVSITSDPPGASVFVDGEYKGTTPLKGLKLAAGSHTVRLEKARHTTWKDVVAFSSFKRSVHAKLKAERLSSINIHSKPKGASVYVNGQFQGETPCEMRDVEPGLYEVLVTCENYEPCQKTVEVGDKAVTVEVKLQSKLERYYLDAIKKNRYDLHSYTELAHHYMIRKDFDDAMAIFEKALKTADSGSAYIPKDAVTRLYAELAKVYVGWFDYATEEEIVKLRPRIEKMAIRSKGYMNFKKQAASWQRQKEPGNRRIRFDPRQMQLDAVRQIEKELLKNPKDIELLVRLSDLHLSAGNSAMALTVLKKALEVAPNDYRVHKALSETYRRLGRHEEGERQLAIAVNLCKDKAVKADLHERLACIYQSRLIDPDLAAEWYPKTVEQWKLAIEFSDDEEQACHRRFRLGLLHKRMGHNEEAAKLFNEILQRSQNDALKRYAMYLLKKSG